MMAAPHERNVKSHLTMGPGAVADAADVRAAPPVEGLEAPDPALAEVAHLLRRLAFGAPPGRARELLDRHGSPEGVRRALLDAPPLPFEPPGDLDAGLEDAPEALDDPDRLVVWWVRRMRSAEVGVHERMCWTWHTLFTTSVDEAPTALCWRQLRTLHQHATGNFGQLLRALLDDAALLVFLDADGSRRQEPNENLARELLELFTLGRGAYGQSDVEAGAVVLAGRHLDWASGAVTVDPEAPRVRARPYLGRDDVVDLDGLCAAILEHDACAVHVVRHVVAALVGTEVDQADLDRWAQDFRAGGYEIAPLIEAVTAADVFGAARSARPRSGLEWFVAALDATGHDEWNAWDLHTLGQMPYRPPGVAGWPGDERWTSATAALGRGTWITWFDPPAAEALAQVAATGGGDRLVEAVLDRCSLHEVSRRTRRALQALAADLLPFDASEDPGPAAVAVLRAAALTPEFSRA